MRTPSHAGWLLSASLLVLGCGRTVPHGGVPKEPSESAPEGPRVTTVTTATDLLPSDLDLVVRVDLTKMRSDLGADASEELLEEALDSSGVVGAAREVLAGADVVWVGLRTRDLETGDHVMVATHKRKKSPEGKPLPLVEPDGDSWKASDTGTPKIRRYVAKTPPTRAGTARIYTVGDTAAVFVSPVEEHSVERILKMGPDPDRGQPKARGMLSLELIAPRLPRNLRSDLAALTKLMASIERVRATVDLVGNDLELDATVRCKNVAAATDVARNLAAYATAETRFAELFGDTKIDRTGSSVLLRWRVPKGLIIDLAAGRSSDD
jgi:hypothetical protein